MPWIKSDSSLRNHPKTRRLARTLNICPFRAIGHLQCLWWWVMEYAPDGDISRHDAVDIAEAAGWDGDPEQFLRALISCGPGDSDGFVDKSMQIHDWKDYGGALHEKRKSNADRQRRHREREQEKALQKQKKNSVTRDITVTSHQNNALEERRGEESRGDKRRVEDNKTGKTIAGEKPSPAPSSADAAEPPEKRQPNIPYQKIVELYHELCPSLPRVAKLTDARKASIRARWKEHPDLEWWASFFGRVEASEFLSGKVSPSPGRERPFLADLEWISKQANTVKILEGKYDNRTGNGNPDDDPWLKRCLDFARNQQPETIDAEVITHDGA